MILNGPEKPSPEDVLAHHGVKGQKWGVRHKPISVESDTGSSESKTDWSKIPQKERPPKEAAKALTQAHKDFANKFQPSEAPGSSKKGLTPEQKKILIGIGVSAAILGGALAYKKFGGKTSVLDLAAKAEHLETYAAKQQTQRKLILSKIEEKYSGKPIPPDDFLQASHISQLQTWGVKGYMPPHAFDRPEFSIPKGNVFHRISLSEEGTFGKGTYSVHNLEDYHRYLVGFSGEKGGGLTKQLHHITFTATDDIKVPNLKTVLDTLHEVQTANGHHYSPEEILEGYQQMSGKNWNFSEVHGQLIDALKKKGFGALVDEMDAGVIGESPLVVFSETVSKKIAHPIAQSDIDNAGTKLIELVNRKG